MEELKKLYERSITLKRRFVSLAYIFFSLALIMIAGFVSLLILRIDVELIPDLVGEGLYLSYVLIEFSSTFISVGVVMLIFAYLLFGRRAKIFKQAMNGQGQPHQNINTVDVKDIPEEKPVVSSKYSNLLKQYKSLYEQGLISKEDYESKKKELESL